MTALFRKVDCHSIPVADLDAALAFYRDGLGHELIWRDDSAAGLRLPDSDAELVLHTEKRPIETAGQIGGSLPFDYGPFGKSRKGKISGLQGATFELKSFRQECGPGMRPGLTGIDDACRDVVAI